MNYLYTISKPLIPFAQHYVHLFQRTKNIQMYNVYIFIAYNTNNNNNTEKATTIIFCIFVCLTTK